MSARLRSLGRLWKTARTHLFLASGVAAGPRYSLANGHIAPVSAPVVTWSLPVCLPLLFSGGHQALHPAWPYLTWSRLQRPYLQTRSLSQEHGVETSTCLFGEQIQPTTVSSSECFQKLAGIQVQVVDFREGRGVRQGSRGSASWVSLFSCPTDDCDSPPRGEAPARRWGAGDLYQPLEPHTEGCSSAVQSPAQLACCTQQPCVVWGKAPQDRYTDSGDSGGWELPRAWDSQLPGVEMQSINVHFNKLSRREARV